MTRHGTSALVLCVALLAACTGFGTRTQESAVELTDTPSWETSIEPLMRVYCNECHSAVPTQGAPPGLRTDVYDDVDGDLGAFSARDRIFARATDTGRPMPPPPARTMSIDELVLLERWIELGGPRTDEDALAAAGAEPCSGNEVVPCDCDAGASGTRTCIDGAPGPCECASDAGIDTGTWPDIEVPDAALADTEVADASAPTVTLTDLHADILAPSCGTPGCHTSTATAPDLATADGLRERLLEASGQAPDIPWVTPGDPVNSYLYLKVRDDFRELGVGRGGRMPSGAPALTDDEMLSIVAWITQGATP